MKRNRIASVLSLTFFLLIANHAFGQWITTTSIGGGPVWSLLATDSTLLAGTYYNGVYLSRNNGTSWTKVNTGIPDSGSLSVHRFAVIDSFLYAGMGNGKFYRSVNSRTPWAEITNVPALGAGYNFAVKEKNLFAGTPGNGVFLSADYGASWTNVGNGLPASSFVLALAANGNNIFAGIQQAGIFLSSNNGASWANVSTLGFIGGGTIWKLFGIDSWLFLAGGLGIYRSGDSGTTWTEVLNHSGPCSFAASGNNIFAGIQGGVYLSTDSGTSWAPIDTGIPRGDFALMIVHALAVNDSFLFAGANDGNVWRLPLLDIATPIRPDQQDNRTLPKVRVNFSGPARSGVLLTYSISSRCDVQVVVYTLSGKRTVVFEAMGQVQGDHSILIDVKGLPSGLYICRFKAGDIQISSRVIIGGR
jgi:photosystem II stability/assembly factor-like uncharacterized protein